jgi:cytochrome c peroxidase
MRNTFFALSVLHLASSLTAQGLPPVPAPAQNPITAEKAVLGKILFWDEQLSSDDTVACGTCHRPATAGGSDPRLGLNPGLDGRENTADDVLASLGIVHQDASNEFAESATFGLDRQVTRRAAQSAITSQYAPRQFWDGRAGPAFNDPLTGRVAIPGGGSLEAQSLHPLMDSTEMAHEGRTWAELTSKLAVVKPLAVATNHPADVAQALAGGTSYPDLFAAAFGDRTITPVRIAFAIATYERTLVADQTPWDRFTAGDPTALTQSQRMGMQAFNQSQCARCHVPPFFTDHSFRTLGLRPVQEDNGRQGVTGNTADRGRFKVPSLRNVGLKRTFMHNGGFSTIDEVLRFYDRQLPNFPDNRDPVLNQVRVPPQARPVITDFVVNALTDPRVAQELPPFDRPRLRSEQAPNRRIGIASIGTGGFVPRLLDQQPASVGSSDFKVGLAGGLGGAPAVFALSFATRTYPIPVPVAVDLDLGRTFGTQLGGQGAGDGLTTLPLPIPAIPQFRGASIFVQGFVVDAGAAATWGLATTQATEFVMF